MRTVQLMMMYDDNPGLQQTRPVQWKLSLGIRSVPPRLSVRVTWRCSRGADTGVRSQEGVRMLISPRHRARLLRKLFPEKHEVASMRLQER